MSPRRRDRLPVQADYQPGRSGPGREDGGPGGGLGLAPEPTAAVALPPPTVSAPPGSRMFRVQGRTTGLVAASGEVELASFRLPTGQVGVIRLAQFEINGLLLTSAITFRVRINRTIPSGGSWSPFPTAAAYYLMELPADATSWRVAQKARVSVGALVTDAGTYAVGTNLQGWFYPIALKEKYDEAWREGL